jgi:hypothetical protein
MTDTLRLTQVCSALQDLIGETPPTYRALWIAAVDGRLPSSVVNGRHTVRRADLPKRAAVMGMTVPAAQPKRQRRKAAEIVA